MRAGLLLAALLLAACATPASGPPPRPERTAWLAGEWDITVKMREDASSDWSEFRTSAVIDELFEGRVLRERPLDTSKPWREIALTRWDAASGELVFEPGQPSSVVYTPRANDLLHFKGELVHEVTEVEGEGLRICLVCEQYNLPEQALGAFPEYALLRDADLAPRVGLDS